VNATEMLDALKEPFDTKVIHWRVGATTKDKDKGIALAYVDARDVMKRLDEVCGIAGWQNRYIMNGAYPVCELGLLIEGNWVWKSDGAGATDYEGEKGALSDAFKRAAVRFGVGRYLYYLPNEWVAIKPAGKSCKIISPPDLPSWAKPGKHQFKPGERQTIYDQVIECLQNGDGDGIDQIFAEYDGIDEQMKLWAIFNSTERAAIKELRK